MKLWQRINNIVAYPDGWQRPAKTEEWVYEEAIRHFPENQFSELLCFPWATLIDLLHRHQKNKAKKYLQALELAPPRRTLIRATVCQHIWAMDMLPWFRVLKITDLFWAHAMTDQTDIDGIRIHPFPLYPVRCLEQTRDFHLPISSRKYLYSFIGAYNPESYLSPARQWIFDLPERDDAFILARAEWHYEKPVYREQIAGETLTCLEETQYTQASDAYVQTMKETVFSLCPSGTGPNSIRFWESLGYGCIPVLISDKLKLPVERTPWETAILRVPENELAIQQLPSRLEGLARDTGYLAKMQQAVNRLWKDWGLNGPATALKMITQNDWIEASLKF